MQRYMGQVDDAKYTDCIDYGKRKTIILRITKDIGVKLKQKLI